MGTMAIITTTVYNRYDSDAADQNGGVALRGGAGFDALQAELYPALAPPQVQARAHQRHWSIVGQAHRCAAEPVSGGVSRALQGEYTFQRRDRGHAGAPREGLPEDPHLQERAGHRAPEHAGRARASRQQRWQEPAEEDHSDQAHQRAAALAADHRSRPAIPAGGQAGEIAESLEPGQPHGGRNCERGVLILHTVIILIHICILSTS